MIGKKLGHYEVLEQVGAGGMGEVYRATDTRLDRTVAIKVLPSHLSDDSDFKQRFDREAKTISSLQHPNICALFDVGHEDGIDFLVMEYLEGDTLADRLREGPLSTDELLRIGLQVTQALDNAHKRGVIHRDLKPGNIMLTKEGVKLLDFGLAKTAEGSAAAPESTLTRLATAPPTADPLTQHGSVMGTFQYMAPEQLEGTEADPRSDIFALGAVLYEMATGRPAFEGASQASLIASIMQSHPSPISQAQPMAPPALDQVIRTCLAKDPDDRWQTAHDVALQLKWIAEGGSQIGVPKPVAARRRSRERTAWIVAVVAALAAIALGVTQFLRPAPEPPTSVRFNIQAPDGVVSFGSPRISPDGRFIAFDGTDSTNSTMVWVRPLNSLTAHPLPGTEGCKRPFWSPDSRHIAFFSVDGRLKRVPVAGGPPITLCEFSRGADGVWGQSGVILFDGAAGDSILSVPAGGGVMTGVTTIARDRGESSHGWPYFLPDGERFVYLAFITGQPDEIRLGQLGSTETTRLTEADSRIEILAPGYLAYERSGTLLAQPFDTGSGQLTGDPFPLAEGIGTGDVGLAHFSGSNDGTLVFTGGDPLERQLVWFDREGRELEAVADAAQCYNPALSPDGRYVAIEIQDPRVETTDLWMIDLRRGVTSRVTFDPADDQTVAWNPDGSTLFFASDRNGQRAIYRKSATGVGNAEKVADLAGTGGPNSVSPDGDLIILGHRAPGKSWDVVSMSIDGGEPQKQVSSEFHEFHGRISPDGRLLSYVSIESGGMEVYITTFPGGGGKWQVSTEGGSEPFWREDSAELFYLSADRGLMVVEISLEERLEIGMPRRLFNAPVPRSPITRNRYVATPDGERFLLLALTDRRQVVPTTVVLNWAAELEQR